MHRPESWLVTSDDSHMAQQRKETPVTSAGDIASTSSMEPPINPTSNTTPLRTINPIAKEQKGSGPTEDEVMDTAHPLENLKKTVEEALKQPIKCDKVDLRQKIEELKVRQRRQKETEEQKGAGLKRTCHCDCDGDVKRARTTLRKYDSDEYDNSDDDECVDLRYVFFPQTCYIFIVYCTISGSFISLVPNGKVT